MHHTFWYISFPFLHDYDVKMPNFAFYRERKQATTKFQFCSFSELKYMVPWNSTLRGFAYNWKSKCVGIIAIKTERTKIHFLSDVLVAIASLDLKVSSVRLRSSQRKLNVDLKLKQKCRRRMNRQCYLSLVGRQISRHRSLQNCTTDQWQVPWRKEELRWWSASESRG